MPLGTPVGERMQDRCDERGSTGGDRTLSEERGDVELPVYDEKCNSEGVLERNRER